MLNCQNAEGVRGQTKVRNPCLTTTEVLEENKTLNIVYIPAEVICMIPSKFSKVKYANSTALDMQKQKIGF